MIRHRSVLEELAGGQSLFVHYLRVPADDTTFQGWKQESRRTPREGRGADVTTGLEKEIRSSAHATLRDALPELAIDSHTRGVDVLPPHAAYPRVTAVPCLWTAACQRTEGRD